MLPTKWSVGWSTFRIMEAAQNVFTALNSSYLGWVGVLCAKQGKTAWKNNQSLVCSWNCWKHTTCTNFMALCGFYYFSFYWMREPKHEIVMCISQDADTKGQVKRILYPPDCAALRSWVYAPMLPAPWPLCFTDSFFIFRVKWMVEIKLNYHAVNSSGVYFPSLQWFT